MCSSPALWQRLAALMCPPLDGPGEAKQDGSRVVDEIDVESHQRAVDHARLDVHDTIRKYARDNFRAGWPIFVLWRVPESDSLVLMLFAEGRDYQWVKFSDLQQPGVILAARRALSNVRSVKQSKQTHFGDRDFQAFFSSGADTIDLVTYFEFRASTDRKSRNKGADRKSNLQRVKSVCERTDMIVQQSIFVGLEKRKGGTSDRFLWNMNFLWFKSDGSIYLAKVLHNAFMPTTAWSPTNGELGFHTSQFSKKYVVCVCVCGCVCVSMFVYLCMWQKFIFHRCDLPMVPDYDDYLLYFFVLH